MTKAFTLIVAVAALIQPGAFCDEHTAVLTIHADKSIAKVSPTLYGLMTEEITRM